MFSCIRMYYYIDLLYLIHFIAFLIFWWRNFIVIRHALRVILLGQLEDIVKVYSYGYVTAGCMLMAQRLRRSNRTRCPFWNSLPMRVCTFGGFTFWCWPTREATGTSWADEMDELPSARKLIPLMYSGSPRHQKWHWCCGCASAYGVVLRHCRACAPYAWRATPAHRTSFHGLCCEPSIRGIWAGSGGLLCPYQGMI